MGEEVNPHEDNRPTEDNLYFSMFIFKSGGGSKFGGEVPTRKSRKTTSKKKTIELKTRSKRDDQIYKNKPRITNNKKDDGLVNSNKNL